MLTHVHSGNSINCWNEYYMETCSENQCNEVENIMLILTITMMIIAHKTLNKQDVKFKTLLSVRDRVN